MRKAKISLIGNALRIDIFDEKGHTGESVHFKEIDVIDYRSLKEKIFSEEGREREIRKIVRKLKMKQKQ